MESFLSGAGGSDIVEIGLKFLWFCEEYFWWNGEGISIMFKYNGSLALGWYYGDIRAQDSEE